MLIAIAILLSLAFIVWLIRLAVKKKPVRAHMVMYMLSWLTGVFSISYFLSMDIERIAKILISIVLGAILIFIAANFQKKQMGGADNAQTK